MPTDYSLADLAALADVPVRTIRYYLAQGLLPGPGREGPSTGYPESTLRRLRLIRQMQRGHLPLAEIRNRIQGLDDREVARLLEEPTEAPSDSAFEYVQRVLNKQAPGPVGAPASPPLLRAMAAPLAVREAPMLGSASVAEPPTEPAAPERSQWERISIEPDIELQVRRPLSRLANKRVERLIAFAHQLRKEDTP